MSFILDALKKSEQERERQQTPSVVEPLYGRTRRGIPWWLIMVVALLVVNFLLLLGMWLRSDKTAPAEVAVNSAASSSVIAPIVTAAPLRNAEVRALDEEAGNDTEAADTTTELLNAPALPDRPAIVRPATGSNQTIINNYPAPTSSNLPTLTALGGSAALNLPELRLDLHVYSPSKTQRFAFINSKKYQEGQTLSEGPLVEAINDEGVVLSYRGQRFLMPRT